MRVAGDPRLRGEGDIKEGKREEGREGKRGNREFHFEARDLASGEGLLRSFPLLPYFLSTYTTTHDVANYAIKAAAEEARKIPVIIHKGRRWRRLLLLPAPLLTAPGGRQQQSYFEYHCCLPP